MTSRKMQHDIDTALNEVAEGIQTFGGIYEESRSTKNPIQRDKLESLEREIKKLLGFRSQIKSWAAVNDAKDKAAVDDAKDKVAVDDAKDKAALLEQRKAIEACMEQFKAVQKDVKEKAYAKEDLSAASQLDPKEKEKVEVCDFLSLMGDELQQRIESMEAEKETLQAQVKEGEKNTSELNRIADILRITDRHEWHIGRLEFLIQSLRNGCLEVKQVLDLKESIKYYVDEGHNDDYTGEDETLYDDLNLDNEAEALFGIGEANDQGSVSSRASSQFSYPPRHSRLQDKVVCMMKTVKDCSEALQVLRKMRNSEHRFRAFGYPAAAKEEYYLESKLLDEIRQLEKQLLQMNNWTEAQFRASRADILYNQANIVDVALWKPLHSARNSIPLRIPDYGALIKVAVQVKAALRQEKQSVNSQNG